MQVQLGNNSPNETLMHEVVGPSRMGTTSSKNRGLIPKVNQATRVNEHWLVVGSNKGKAITKERIAHAHPHSEARPDESDLQDLFMEHHQDPPFESMDGGMESHQASAHDKSSHLPCDIEPGARETSDTSKNLGRGSSRT